MPKRKDDTAEPQVTSALLRLQALHSNMGDKGRPDALKRLFIGQISSATGQDNPAPAPAQKQACDLK
jgi:hypothetical protein